MVRSNQDDECMIAVNRLKDGPADIYNIMCSDESSW